MSKVFTITEGLENMGALKTGGQGSVYKARRMGPIITAVKLLPTPIHSESPEDKHYADFQNEVAKLKRANAQPNPNVVKFLSSGITESGALPFIEMEFIEGPDLEELLHPPHDPVFTIKEAIKVADHLSNALAHCHRLDIRHGDIKSNNVKLNIHTGNYVLLDFGLAIMSDEQRRTSLRHAGAIEFMAPEQNDGRMLSQSDVYSFGIILYELLAGKVPFPLTNNSENARNQVRLQHMEAPVPNLMQLRLEHIPETWSAEKKERESHVPQWMLEMLDRCLQKRPEQRFANGVELHEFLVQHMVQTRRREESSGIPMGILPQEKDRLTQEIANLQRQLKQQTDLAAAKEAELTNLRVALTRRDQELNNLRNQRPAYAAAAAPPTPPPVIRGRDNSMRLPMILVAVFLVGAVLYMAINNLFGSSSEPDPNTENRTEQPEQRSEPARRVLGEYKVVAERAYFHNEAEESSRRSAYMVPSEEVIKALEDQNGFIYTEFTNNRGQTSKGWLLKSDLLTVDEWNERQSAQQVPLTKIEINRQLQQAREFVDQRNMEGAFAIYRSLTEQEVPEAMFEWGNRALKAEHSELDCDAAYAMVQKAAEREYAPAKRTLGFLYLFGQNKDVLRASKYNRCSFDRNILRGTRLLIEAAGQGDSTATEILDDYNKEQNQGQNNEDGVDTSQ